VFGKLDEKANPRRRRMNQHETLRPNSTQHLRAVYSRDGLGRKGSDLFQTPVFRHFEYEAGISHYERGVSAEEHHPHHTIAFFQMFYAAPTSSIVPHTS